MSEFKQVVKEGAQTLWKKAKKMGLILSLVALAGLGGYIWVCGWTYSEGTRAGQLVKVSYKGVVFKTFEGQLNLGGLQSTPQGGVIGNTWDFSTAKRSVFEELSRMEGKQVKLHYRQRYRVFAWQGDTPYFVYKVEEINQ